MSHNTETAIAAMLAVDTTIPKATAARALAILRGDQDENAALDRRISRAEAARLLGVSGKTIERWTKRGILRRIGGTNGTMTRYSRNSVLEFLQGGKPAA